MSYQALYRKYRPSTLKDVIGQDVVIKILKNAVINNKIGHAYLFSGPRGIGKTTIAKALAKTVNCLNQVDGDSCEKCTNCKSINGGFNPDIIEIDAASNNGVDEIREIKNKISLVPNELKYKVYIIDEVHMLSIGAFNALLKTLEEPPSYVIFILATTEVHKIPITILSRCQRYDFRRIGIDIIADRLKELTAKEEVTVEEKALRYVAKAADGSMRDALSLLDQCIAFNYGKELTYDRVLGVLGAVDTAVFGELFSCLIRSDVQGALELLSRIVTQGRELSQFVNDFIWYLRNMMLVMTSDNIEDAVDMSSDNLKDLKELAESADIDTIMRYIRVFSDLSASLRFAPQKRILIEVAIIRICRPQMDEDNAALLDRIRILEEKSSSSEKILEGIQSGQISVAASGSGSPSTQGKDVPAPQKQVLESAVADDVKRIVNNWNRILSGMESPMRNYLNKAALSQGNDGRLFIVLDVKERVDKYNEEPGHSELGNILDNAIGKHVEFEMRLAGQDRPVGEEYIDLKGIHFDIVTEDEESMPPIGEAVYEDPDGADNEPDEDSGGVILSGPDYGDDDFDDENAFEEKDID